MTSSEQERGRTGWIAELTGHAWSSLEGVWRRIDRWTDRRFGSETQGDAAIASGFKPDAVALEEEPVPLPAHAALYSVIALLLVAILWAVLGSVDRIVVGAGKIATQTPVIVLQPFTTSRIQRLFVKAGDHVSKGQVLVSFDPAFARADLATLAQRAHALKAEADRMAAQLGGTIYDAGRGSDPDRMTQAQIFQQQMAEYAAEMASRDSQEQAVDSLLAAANASISGLKRQLAMAQKVVSIRKYLLAEHAGAPLDVMAAEHDEIDTDLKLKNAIADVRKLSEQRAGIEADRQSYVNKWRSDLNQHLVETRQNLAEAEQTLSKAQRMEDLTQLKAPVDGVVLEMADRSEGSVLREAETLVTMVPDAAELYVEANIQSRDIAYVHVGNPVRVKLEAYPYQRNGTIEGELTAISPDSVPLKENDQSTLVYRSQVRLKATAGWLAQHGFRLRPGMIASAEIKTGRRTVASYILDPIFGTIDEGLREP